MQAISLFWFRRDLRLSDNAGLYHALKSGLPVLPIFIFDQNILSDLRNKQDARVAFIHDTITALRQELNDLGSTLIVRYGTPETEIASIIEAFPVAQVYCNRDYEPYATDRDKRVADLLASKGIPLHSFKDHVILEQDEVLKSDGLPYTVFTPYSRRWMEKLNSRLTNGQSTSSYFLKSYPNARYFSNFLNVSALSQEQQLACTLVPTLADLGFAPADITIPSATVARSVIKQYDKNRDFPGLDATSKLGIHFRFGTISIREKARNALELNITYLNELIWRDFYSQILAHFPHVVTQSFRPQYERIAWREAPEEFELWSKGMTGYPIVDAGMRQLNATGFMHNRVRMIVASFLSKHLLINWRMGEAYFAEKLLDYDLASNSGGWQWAAGCGTDAAPYFRIFSPEAQTKKFDPKHAYIKKWVPEFGTNQYPAPMVPHAFARERCLAVYKRGLEQG